MEVTAERETAVRKGLVLSVIGVCFLVVMMDNTILNVALPTLQKALSASNSQLQWAVDSYILVYAALMFPAGVIADSYGRRKVLLAGLAVFVVASALSAMSTSPGELILWRAVMGLGGAVVPPATLAIIKHVFPPSEHGKAMGVWAGVGGLSVAFGPIIGGALLEHFWWGSVFLINVPIVLVCAVLIVFAVPESRALRRPRLDLPGIFLSIAAISALVYGVIRGGETNSWASAGALGMILVGLVLTGLLVVVERRTAEPALDVTLFASAPFTVGTLSISLSFFALTGGTFLLVFYAQLVRGYSPLQLGLMLLPVAIGSVVSAVTSAKLTRKHGPRLTVVVGLILLLISLGGLYGLSAATSLWIVELVLLSAGLGMGFVMSTTTTLVMAVVPEQKSGVGAAVNNTLRQVGAALGVAVMGSVYSVAYRSHFGDTLHAVKPPLPAAASESLSGTLYALSAAAHNPAAARLLAPALPGFTARAKDSFMSAMHVSVLWAIIVLAFATVLASIWLPTRQTSARNADQAVGETAVDDTVTSH